MLMLIAAELQIRQNEVGIYNILMYKAERNRLKTQKGTTEVIPFLCCASGWA